MGDRGRAVAEATPHLVHFNAPSVHGAGNRGATAMVVRDSDRGYQRSTGNWRWTRR